MRDLMPTINWIYANNSSMADSSLMQICTVSKDIQHAAYTYDAS